MYNFNFHNPTRIYFGNDRLHELAKAIPSGNKLLILYGGGSVVKFGTLDKVKNSLKAFEFFELRNH
jgi:NADP-dependent alcohol dehydrogenase